MKLSDQALGAIMNALQKSLLEQTDIVPILKSMEFTKDETTKRWGTKNGELVVTNPPNFSIENISFNFEQNINGKIENGRPEYWIGAHVKGKNESSLGVCLIGRDEFTVEQFNSLKIILKTWKNIYPKANILGHCNTGNTDKTCPNFDVKTWAKDKFT